VASDGCSPRYLAAGRSLNPRRHCFLSQVGVRGAVKYASLEFFRTCSQSANTHQLAVELGGIGMRLTLFRLRLALLPEGDPACVPMTFLGSDMPRRADPLGVRLYRPSNSIILISSQKDQWSTYHTSSVNLSSQVSALRPLI